jgi:CheY-like chemotaxis protein
MTLRVFVADDSVTIQKIVTLAFAGEDVVIEAASDGNAARELLQRFNPDIVLADVFMPGCNGYGVCEYVKETPELKHVPVILLVGTFEPFDQGEAARVRCDGFLTKPFDTEELIQAIRAQVGDKLPALTPAEGDVTEKANIPKLGRQVSCDAMTSFLGENRILDVFDEGAGIQRPVQPASLSEDTLNLIVDKVVRKMSPEVIREVAWEVVPELSETIIRQNLKEQK